MKSIQISTRVTQEDADFLAELELEGAHTPSDKLRGLIGEARARRESKKSYGAALSLLREVLGPTSARVLSAEAEVGKHSELVGPFMEWLMEASAYCLAEGQKLKGESGAEAREQELVAFEAGVSERSSRLLSLFLRLGISDPPPLYEQTAFLAELGKLLRLAEVVAQSRKLNTPQEG